MINEVFTYSLLSHSPQDVVINLRDPISAMSVDPIVPFQIAVGSADGVVRIYDRRMLKMGEVGGMDSHINV